MKDERVYCVAADKIESCIDFRRGVMPAPLSLLERFVTVGEGVWLWRSECETDERYRQLIPYVVFRAPSVEDGRPLIFSYRRSKASGEERLIGKASVGIGGHMNPTPHLPVNCKGLDLFWANATREVDEEVEVNTESAACNFKGFINDCGDPVGRVHLGCLVVYDLKAPMVKPRCESIANPRWASIEWLTLHAEEYEGWSQLVINSGAIA